MNELAIWWPLQCVSTVHEIVAFSGHYQNGQLFETQKKIPNEMQIILSSSCMVILIFRILAPLAALFWMRDSVKNLEKIVTKKVPLEIEHIPPRTEDSVFQIAARIAFKEKKELSGYWQVEGIRVFSFMK